MPFEILSPIREVSSVPEGTYLRTDLGGRVQVAPNVDANNGTLEIDAETTSVTYVDANGNTALVPVALPENLLLYNGQGAVFGADLDKFLVPVGEVDEGQFNAYFGLIEVAIADDGTPVLSELMQLPSGSSYYAEFEVYTLGDGRVGFLMGSAGGDVTGLQGIFVDGEDDIEIELARFGTPFDNSSYFMALPDGGTLALTNDSDDTFTANVKLKQYDADGTLVASGETGGWPFDFDTGNGPPPDFTLSVDDNGDLSVIYSTDLLPDGTEGQELRNYEIVYDLLPVDEEPPVEPPVEDPDVIFGTEGDDSFAYLEGQRGDPVTVYGGDGADFFDGGPLGSVLYAGDGNDQFFSTGNENSVYAGAGDDLVLGVGSDVLVDAGTGDDEIEFVGSGSSIFGRGGQDEITSINRGFLGDNDLRGGDDDDDISGGRGDDFIRGNHGDDDLTGGDGADDMNGGFGDDHIGGGDGDDKVSGFDGADEMYGGAGNDMMHGGRGNDVMFGGAGDDVLRGADGADQLWATGGGADLLIGGDGADAFGISGDAGEATVKDFILGTDVIASDAGIEFADIVISQDGKDALVQVGDSTLRLVKVDSSQLSEADFLFLDPPVEPVEPIVPAEPVEPIVPAEPVVPEPVAEDLFLPPEESAVLIEEAAAEAEAADPVEEEIELL